MVEAKRKGTVLYRPDGTHYPSFAGLNWTEKERTRIGDALRGRPKSMDQVAKQSTVWNQARPLFLRGAINAEMSEITGIDRNRIGVAVRTKRPSSNSVSPDFFLKEKILERKKKTEAWLRKGENTYPSVEERQKDVAIAKALMGGGFIDDNIDFWNKMVSVYVKNKREITKSFPQRLRLEIFYRATEARLEGDFSLLQKYRAILAEEEGGYFDNRLAEEERFISGFITADRLRRTGYARDGKGLYRPDPETGGKWREIK